MTADKDKTEAMKLYAKITFFCLSGIPADKKKSSKYLKLASEKDY